MMVNEIFTSIEGEGIRAGRVCTFVRFTGCNLRCEWCDTAYAFDDGSEMDVAEILEAIPADARCVTVTGGEPLLQDGKELRILISALVERGVEVNIETNGSVDFTGFLEDGVIVTADCKPPSSGMSGRMDMKPLSKLRGCDVLKFVVATDADLEFSERVAESLKPSCHVFLSPVFGRMDPARLAEWLKNSKMKDECDARMQIQMHKAIWPPETRGV